MRIHRPKSIQTVFEWLEEVRARPGMYFTELSQLEDQLHGYNTALAAHGIDENVPSMRHFAAWLGLARGWPMSLGWARAITDQTTSLGDAAGAFFELVDEYRRLRPVVRARVRLRARHRPTGTRVKIGLDGVHARPNVIEIRQLSPEPLHYLRFIYAEQRMDLLPLHDNGSNRTTLSFAKRWVADEYLVTSSEWERSQRPPPRAPKRRRSTAR